MTRTDATTAVLLIAHGSRHAAANDDLHALAARLSASADYAIVEPCFLELAEPDIAGGADRCVARGATRVLMIPYFLAAGVHLRRDLTAARDALAAEHPAIAFVLGPPLGPDPCLDQLVTERIRQTAAMPNSSGFPERASVSNATPRPAPFADCTGAASAIDTNRSKD